MPDIIGDDDFDVLFGCEQTHSDFEGFEENFESKYMNFAPHD